MLNMELGTRLKDNFLLIIFTMIMISACKKPNERACLKTAGEEAEIEIEMGQFDQLYLGPHIKFTLVPDSVNKLVLSGGENLLPFIETEIVDGKLSISNTNKCNFLRSYKHEINVDIHFKSVYFIESDITKELNCSDTIHGSYVELSLKESAGKFNLLVDANYLRISIQTNWGNFEVKGKANFFRGYASGNGFGNAEELEVRDSIYFVSKSTEDFYFNAEGVYLRAQTLRRGDIYYTGIPDSIDFDQNGTGNLIDNN